MNFKLRKFFNWWRCQANPEKLTFGWNNTFTLLDYGLSSTRTFTFPAEPDGPCLNYWFMNRMGIDDELDRIYGREHRR